VTLDNIKHAFIRHSAPMVGECMICDALGGEQGPSCASLDQIHMVQMHMLTRNFTQKLEKELKESENL